MIDITLFTQPFEVPEGTNLDQDSEVEIVGSKEVGYTESRSLDVKKLREYFFPPKVCSSLIMLFFISLL